MALPLSLLSMCEEAYQLNILARERRMKSMRSTGFYILKDQLVKYLYQHGHAIEVIEHVQKLECWSCGGDGCFRCDGTGIYRSHILYAFKFEVSGRHFKWHQLAKHIDYSVALTDPSEKSYISPISKKEIDMDYEEETWAIFRLWLGLLVRGCNVPRNINLLALLPNRIRGFIFIMRFEFRNRLDWLKEWVADHSPLRLCRQCRHLFIPEKNSDHPHFCSDKCVEDFVPF